MESEGVAAWLESGLPCLDARPAAAFALRRLVPSLNVPLGALESSVFELPPKHEPVFVLARPGAEKQAVQALLHARGWAMATVLEDDDLTLWRPAELANRVQGGPVSATLKPPILFRPSQSVVDWIPHIESCVGSRGPGRPPTCVDLGCGAGRDAIFLASRGWRVVAVDALPVALDRVARMAQTHRVSDQVRTALCRVRGDGSLQGDTGPLAGTFDLVLGVRFLQKAFMPRAAELVAPAGFVLWETFAAEGGGPDAVAKTPRNQGRLLDLATLEQSFPSTSFQVLLCETRHLADERILRCFVAQRKGATA